MPLFPLAFCVILGYYTRDWGILFRVCPFRVPKSLLPERATINYWTHRVQYRVGNRHQNRMKERDQRMTRGKEGDGGWHKRKDKKDEDSPNQQSQKNTKTSSGRRSPTTTSSGRTTRILPTPTGKRTPAFTPPPLLPIPVPAARATRAAANANARGTHDGDGVAGPAESEESAGDGGGAQPRGANVRAVGSRRCISGSEGEVAGGAGAGDGEDEDALKGQDEGVNAGAAGL